MIRPLNSAHLTAAIRHQIEALDELVAEMEEEHLSGEEMAWRIEAVEIQLRQLRETSRPMTPR